MAKYPVKSTSQSTYGRMELRTYNVVLKDKHSLKGFLMNLCHQE